MTIDNYTDREREFQREIERLTAELELAKMKTYAASISPIAKERDELRAALAERDAKLAALAEQEPVGEVDEDDDGLFVDLETLVGTVVERGQKLYAAAGARPGFDLITHLHRQIAFSERTFGPGERTAGVVDHIAKELYEVLDGGGELEEWVDVIILALDGAWRSGNTPEQISAAIVAKQTKNESRTWPDWRTAAPGKAIEHVRSAE